ncbi:hypothetical protein COY26_04290 [Candidatus Woesearchaeota archaeon CG_4_10_14_0_2_um_filter_33_10]|nr:MAG: hypothetical protein AUJ83_00275 [Candidatus Woesearchaeota archaeon CG1_02_33_12]PIZ52563.1 MAG: hypothetical protein COY26_04290 [Candidatus Woesearchaeota archaeon CG_4_10_14_0_2_um_filter_33_10]
MFFEKYILQKIKLYKSKQPYNFFRMFFLRKIIVSGSRIGYFFYLINIYSKLTGGGFYFFN